MFRIFKEDKSCVGCQRGAGSSGPGAIKHDSLVFGGCRIFPCGCVVEFQSGCLWPEFDECLHITRLKLCDLHKGGSPGGAHADTGGCEH